jgi:hypothetical protein
MRRIILAVSAVGAISAAGSSPASAAYEYPYCMQSRTMGTECYYTSYNQCMASANGLGAECIVNPIVAFAQQYQQPQPQPQPRQRRARRAYD